MNIICKACNKKIRVYEMKGSELLNATSILSHMMTCKELKKTADTNNNFLVKIIDLFFEKEA